MEKVLLAGATGYLGSYILAELMSKGIPGKVVVRNSQKLPKGLERNHQIEILEAEVTKPDSIQGCCKGVSIVISTVGITRQKDGLSYMDVDYQANLNLLEEAQKSGVKKFIYVSALNGEKLTHLKIGKAKEMFVDKLKASGMDYCIIRPGGFFSDLAEMYNMAAAGRIYLFGDGELKSNPIHGADLAERCVAAIKSSEKEIEIGGPEVLSQNEIAQIAFAAAGKREKITYVPDWLRRLVLKLGNLIMSEAKFGPIEFFLNVLAMEMTAPTYGRHRLKEYYEELNKKSQHTT